MILSVNKVTSLDNDYVDIKYRELTNSISQIIEICNQSNQTLIGEIDGKKYPIDICDILYIEWVDNHSCICTAENIFNSTQSLSQLEVLLNDKDFIRVSKPMIVNIRKVKWISSMLNMKLSAELINGERIAVSRRYRDSMLDRIYRIGANQ